MERQTSHANYPVRIRQELKPETIIVWGLPLAFCIHLLDEIFLNGGFVLGLKRHPWSAYDAMKVGLVNAVFFILISLSNYLCFIRPAGWIVLPLFWLWECTWNGFWHVLWSLIWKEYAPGLVTGFLFGLILLWFLRKESPAEQSGSRKTSFTATAGMVFELLFISTFILPR